MGAVRERAASSQALLGYYGAVKLQEHTLQICKTFHGLSH